MWGATSNPTASGRLGRRWRRQATCHCPYDWGGWCKHIAAALLAGLDNRTKSKSVPLPDLLSGLDREQLQALVLKLADYERGSSL